MNDSNLSGDIGQRQRRPVRKPPILLLVFLGIMALFLYARYRAVPGQSTPGPVVIPDISNDMPNFHSPPNPNDKPSDWSMDADVPSAALENQTEVVIRKGRVSATTQTGDGSLEASGSNQ